MKGYSYCVPPTTEQEVSIMTPLFHKILTPIDFDENSLMALDYAAYLARQNNATVYLVHVVPTDEWHLHRTVYQPTEGGGANPDWAEQVTKTNLEQIAQERFHGVPWEIRTWRGFDPADGILEIEKEVGADLVVMATHGRTGLAHLLHGSVTEKVIRESAYPVLSVRKDQERSATQPFANILVPIEIDDKSPDVLAHVRDLALQHGSTVHVLHIVPTEKVALQMNAVYHPRRGGEEPSLVEAERAVKEYLEKVAREHLSGVRYETVMHVSRDPGKTILEVEKDLGADLLVMATHGFTGIFHMLLGSLTEKMMRESLCPVLTLHLRSPLGEKIHNTSTVEADSPLKPAPAV